MKRSSVSNWCSKIAGKSLLTGSCTRAEASQCSHIQNWQVIPCTRNYNTSLEDVGCRNMSDGDMFKLCTDRYVIVGCHFDAWTYGGVSPNTGTAVMMELVKAMTLLKSTGEVNMILVRDNTFFVCIELPILLKKRRCNLLFNWNNVRGITNLCIAKW